MKTAPTLYIVTTEIITSPRKPVTHAPCKPGGQYEFGAQPFNVIQPTVRYATTSHWLARLVAWLLRGTLIYDRCALLEYQVELEDYT